MDEINEGDAELYARLMPYILRDFASRKDMINLMLLNFSLGGQSFIDNADSSEGVKIALYYKELIESGAEDLATKIKPVIEI